MTRRTRLDVELVRRHLARSREHAGTLIADGRVRVGGQAATKSATAVTDGVSIVVTEPAGDPDYVSRGGHKLAGALDAFPSIQVTGRRCLDAGACTGGFTDVLLRRGAHSVAAVDVGYGQLAWSLRTDERVRVVERTNVRTMVPEDIGGPVELIVADLSFISLRLVFPALFACALPGADILPMVKPQFEVGKDQVGAGGVVRDPQLRAAAVCDVARAAGTMGYGVAGAVASPLPGPAGNVEYFLWLRADATGFDPQIVQDAVQDGPQ